ncbi:MAG: RES family NAD+ phosphorylase [Microthrixaceae bacterium]|nr:RES family NAD+ phosphorylase [Microthrixaceae bacterium]
MMLRHPFVDLSAFPTSGCDKGTELWRIAAAERATAPWWFSNSGEGRFDLNRHSGYGTCYLAESPLGCLLETIWRDVVPTGDPNVLPPIAAAEVASLRAVKVKVPSNYRCADVTGQGSKQLHTSFGITDAIGTCDSYLRPQEWAGAWRAHDLDGVAYRLSHGTGLNGWALFGQEGARNLPGVSIHHVNNELLNAEGVSISSAPGIAELDVVDDEATARNVLATPMAHPRLSD